MCGIFGILTRNRRVDPALLERATRSLAHRGPDDSGTLILKEDYPEPMEIGLGHRRLSILDLSPLGHQPMQDPASGNWIVFNGEIYNFRSLRDELATAGATFKTNCDTEVILAAYRVWGDSCLTRLRGMFAFALWDAPRKRLLLARDPLGIKPLYYHLTEQTFLFSSEVRTLLGTGLVPRKPEPTGVLSFLAFGSVYEPWTIVEAVKSLPPGHLLTIEKGSTSIREYWNPLQLFSSSQSPPSSSNAIAAIHQLPAILSDAVLSHLVSDVPVGIFLSGGIDSSALVAILSQNGVRPNTFSLVFQEADFDEAQYSREVARVFDTDHHEISISQQDAVAILPEALAAMDQPTIDGINTYLVSGKTRAAGLKVALTGLGADEMFAGYSNFRRVPEMEKLARRLQRLPRIARTAIAASIELFGGEGDRGRKLANLVSDDNSREHPYFLVRSLFGIEQRKELLEDRFADSEHALDTVLRQSIALTSALDPVNRVSYLESHWYMRNTLLRDSDFMSMAHGLELRVPFLDRPLVEACFRIPGSEKTGSEKTGSEKTGSKKSGFGKIKGRSPKALLLASLGVELPPEIIHRPKRGFTLPFEQWLRSDMRPVVEETLLHKNWDQTSIRAAAVREIWTQFLDRRTSWSRPWSLFVLHRWCEQNL